jgi:hypothetical protein
MAPRKKAAAPAAPPPAADAPSAPDAPGTVQAAPVGSRPRPARQRPSGTR